MTSTVTSDHVLNPLEEVAGTLLESFPACLSLLKLGDGTAKPEASDRGGSG